MAIWSSCQELEKVTVKVSRGACLGIAVITAGGAAAIGVDGNVEARVPFCGAGGNNLRPLPAPARALYLQ